MIVFYLSGSPACHVNLDVLKAIEGMSLSKSSCYMQRLLQNSECTSCQIVFQILKTAQSFVEVLFIHYSLMEAKDAKFAKQSTCIQPAQAAYTTEPNETSLMACPVNYTLETSYVLPKFDLGINTWDKPRCCS